MCKLEHYFITEPAVAKDRLSCEYINHCVLSSSRARYQVLRVTR